MRSLEEKIGQMLIVGFEGLEPPSYILDWLASGRIGGVILFARNVESPQQLAKLTQACHEAAKYPILIGIDQEGGVVARLHKGFTESPGAMALSAGNSEDMAERMAHVLGREMRALGINWTYAPVVDVTHSIDNTSVGTRSLGVDKDHVARLALAQIRGFQTAGVAACAKHFPGLGNTPVDTHEALAVISGPVDYLREKDLVPFQEAVKGGVDTIMTTHVKFEALDSEYPATLSPVILGGLLREEIGYDRVVATDCMEMRAITDHYGAAESAALAALAGADIIHFSHTRDYQEQAYAGLLEAAQSGRLSEAQIDQALARIDKLKQMYAITETPSIEIIRRPDHLAIAQAAARAGVVLLRRDDRYFPIDFGKYQHVGLVEFASYMDSEVMETGGDTNFVGLLRGAMPHVNTISLAAVETDPQALEKAYQVTDESDLLILVTRNAHLIPNEAQIATELLNKAKPTILVCLRNPYDFNVLPDAAVVLCTCGDSAPSLQAAIDALKGAFEPMGKLPVPVQVSTRTTNDLTGE